MHTHACTQISAHLSAVTTTSTEVYLALMALLQTQFLTTSYLPLLALHFGEQDYLAQLVIYVYLGFYRAIQTPPPTHIKYAYYGAFRDVFHGGWTINLNMLGFVYTCLCKHFLSFTRAGQQHTKLYLSSLTGFTYLT
jgi:hypothetical protein